MRVNAAMAWVSLAPRFAANEPLIVDMMEKLLADPVPAVRLQVARNLNVLCHAAPERMWAMAKKLAAEERDGEVLASLLNHPMHQLFDFDPDGTEAVIEIVRERFKAAPSDGPRKEGRDHVHEVLGNLVAQLDIGLGRPRAADWVEAWASDPVSHETCIKAYLSACRNSLFLRYAADAGDDDRAMADRAQAGLTLIVNAALPIAAKSLELFNQDPISEADKDKAIERYRAAENIIDRAMSQFYFGSGAYRNRNEPTIGLETSEAMSRFLADYASVLRSLATSNEPRTHHHLVELYEYLIPGDPTGVFDALHALLLGPAKREGYQYETLGIGAVVKAIKRYLADHRAIFEDEARRAELVEILQLFSDVGWQPALKLLYELPDLLR